MEVIAALFVTVLGGVICHFIVKWLDRNDKDDKKPSGCFATIKEKKNPLTVHHTVRGFVLCLYGD